MHSFLRDQLQNTYDAARTGPSPKALAYLQLFGPIHRQWHSVGVRRLGFLAFHWYVVRDFKRIRGPQFLGGTSAYTLNQLAAFGADYDADVTVPAGGLSELQNFSLSIEAWHNEAHMAVTMADGIDLMNPLTNIFLRQFWKLHFFINKKFEQKLKAYGKGIVSNPTPTRVLNHLEATFHWVLPAI